MEKKSLRSLVTVNPYVHPELHNHLAEQPERTVAARMVHLAQLGLMAEQGRYAFALGNSVAMAAHSDPVVPNVPIVNGRSNSPQQTTVTQDAEGFETEPPMEDRTAEHELPSDMVFDLGSFGEGFKA